MKLGVIYIAITYSMFMNTTTGANRPPVKEVEHLSVLMEPDDVILQSDIQAHKQFEL